LVRKSPSPSPEELDILMTHIGRDHKPQVSLHFSAPDDYAIAKTSSDGPNDRLLEVTPRQPLSANDAQRVKDAAHKASLECGGVCKCFVLQTHQD